MKEKLNTLIISRRFLVAVGSVLVVIFHDGIGIPEESVTGIVNVAIAWILGDTYRKT
jgi:hypothetical protein